MKCSCCGLQRARLATLQCHAEIGVCPECVGWLRRQAGGLDVTPILPILDMKDSIAFYTLAGFTVRLHEPGAGYAFVQHDDVSAFDLDLAERAFDPTTNGAGCYVVVADVDDWHARLSAARLPVTDVLDQPWGMRELTLTDPSGNRLRIGRPAET